jgi:hypothetical protein
MRRVAVPAAILVIAGLAAPAAAHGRLPESKSIVFRKGTPEEMAIGTSIGLMLSQDNGAHFFWVCEEAVFGGAVGIWDPDYKIATDGTIYANTPTGLRISRDGGCSFEDAKVEPALTVQTLVEDLDLGPNDEVWLVQTDNGKINDAFVTTDGGHEFKSAGLGSSIIWWKSVKVAHSNPKRVYVSGYQITQVAPDGGQIAPMPHVLRTDDGGAHWTELPIGDFTTATSPMVVLLGVSPTDPELVYAVSQNANAGGAGDLVYRSTDGGTTWKQVLATPHSVTSFTFLADGTELVGTGNGAWHSTDGVAFTPLTSPPQMSCVTQRDDGMIYACGTNWDPDYAAVATAPPTTITPWTKQWRFVELAGPLSCPAGTIQKDLCDLQLWPSLKENLGIGDVDGPPPDAAPPPPMKKPGGCCDADGGDGLETAVIVVLAVGIGGLLVRRGKKKKACCQ